MLADPAPNGSTGIPVALPDELHADPLMRRNEFGSESDAKRFPSSSIINSISPGDVNGIRAISARTAWIAMLRALRVTHSRNDVRPVVSNPTSPSKQNVIKPMAIAVSTRLNPVFFHPVGLASTSSATWSPLMGQGRLLAWRFLLGGSFFNRKSEFPAATEQRDGDHRTSQERPSGRLGNCTVAVEHNAVANLRE